MMVEGVSELQHFDNDGWQAKEGNYGDEAKSLSQKSWRRIFSDLLIANKPINQLMLCLNDREKDSSHMCYC